ncbi:MAG: YggT family protein [Pseudomonadota bacterium]
MNFFAYLIKFIYMVLNIYMWIVIISAVVTWVNPDPMNPIIRALRAMTEPVYSRIRRMIPTSFGGLDLAPMIVILAILFIQQVIFPTLLGWLNS